MPYERVSRGKCPLGRYVLIDTLGWDQDKRRYNRKRTLIPQVQFTNHLLGYDLDTGIRNATISRSVSYWSDLTKWAKIKWRKP